MHKILITLSFLFLLLFSPVTSHSKAIDKSVTIPEIISLHVPNARLLGHGRFRFLFWNVYDAYLYTPKSTWTDTLPYALRLDYLRKLYGKEIADRSITEMRKQGHKDEVKLATWHKQMRHIFPDVKKGSTLTGIRTASGSAIFYYHDKEIGRITDPAFTSAFFNIWLSEKTSEPAFRKKLLGKTKDDT